MKEILSEQYTLNLRDFLRGAVLAILAAVLPLVEGSLSAGELTFNWKAIGITAIGAFVAYIGRAFFEKTKVVTVQPTQSKVEALKTAGK